MVEFEFDGSLMICMSRVGEDGRAWTRREAKNVKFKIKTYSFSVSDVVLYCIGKM